MSFMPFLPAEVYYLVAISLVAWLWLGGMQAKDSAITAGRQAAERYGLQLLDETVEIKRIWAARDASGRLRIMRTYAFEVSDTGANRLPCTLTLLGTRLEHLEIPPHREVLH